MSPTTATAILQKMANFTVSPFANTYPTEDYSSAIIGPPVNDSANWQFGPIQYEWSNSYD